MHEPGDNSSGRKEGKDQNMKRILIFSGTTEGRRITEFLDGRNVKVYVSAATEYGKECTGEHENAEVFFGRMDQKQMAEMIKEKADRSGDRCNSSIRTDRDWGDKEGLRNLRCAVSALPAGEDGSSAG